MPERRFRWAVGEPDGRQSPPWTLTVRGSEVILAARSPRQRWHVEPDRGTGAWPGGSVAASLGPDRSDASRRTGPQLGLWLLSDAG
jgi:hypothetical protein